MKKIYPLLAYSLFFFHANAQELNIRFEKYTAQNGLTRTATGALLQDSHGFLWIGTSWGLNRYDGRVIKQYNKIGDNNLADLAISSLAEDKEGNIWIATGNGLSCFDPFTEKFTNYKEGKSSNNIPDGICIVYVDRTNNVWVGTANNISLFDRATQTFENIPVMTAGKEIRINRYIGGFLEDSKGRFWISTSYGAKLFNKVSRTFKSYHFEELSGGVIANAVNGLFEDKDGTIWAGTWNAGILKFDEINDRFINYPIPAESGSQQTVHTINSIIVNDHYYLLLATEEGLFLTDPSKITEGKAPVGKILQESNDSSAVFLKNKWQIIKDRQQNYWISGASGLLKIDPVKQPFQWRILPDKNSRTTTVFHVIPDIKEPDQKAFLTTQKGWWRYEFLSRTISSYMLPEGYKELLGNINRFVATDSGYWFTSQVGLGFYNPSLNKITDFSSLIRTKKDGIVRTGVICMDEAKRIWFSVFRTGIRVYDPKTKKLVSLFADSTSKDNLIGKSIFDMKKAPDGTIFFTNAQKLFTVDPNNFSYSSYTVPDNAATGQSLERTGPRKILFDRTNRALVLSWQRIYELRNGKLQQLYPLKGVANFMMQDFFQNNNGDFWIRTNLGLYKSDSLFSDWINMSDKIPIDDFDDISDIFRSGNDEIILTTIGKIGTFSLHELKKNDLPPGIIINRLRTGNKEQYLVSLRPQQWNVSFKDAIEIEVSAINFSNERGNKIFYQLSGRDNDWKELTGNPVIRYEQLPPENYTFKVRAVNGDGISSNEAVLNFKVLPPFWRTWWFIGACILAISGILYFLYRSRVKQLIKEERLRSHIATDLHDDIGATLSSISFYSETIKQQTAAQLPQLTPILDRMGETSREMVGNMSDIVWAINPQNDPFDKMLSRMQNLAAELCTLKRVELHFTADEQLDRLQLSMEQRRNIFLIYKEALNNALKYSGCSNIYIDLKKENHLLVLWVKDDGKGFNQQRTTEELSGGNGLINMQRRAEEIGGELKINTGENNGTMVLLKVSIT